MAGEGGRMDDNRQATWVDEIPGNPLIRQLGDLAAELLGTRLLVVYPTANGWGQIYGDGRSELLPAFCKLLQGARNGASHCKMCHILLAVAASSGKDPAVQRCHAGASVMVCPVAGDDSESVAILSSCTFADKEAWKDAVARGKSMGVDLEPLRQAFLRLPKLDERQYRILESFMRAMSLAIQAIRRGSQAEARLRGLEQEQPLRTDLGRFLRNTDWIKAAAEDESQAGGGARMPPLIRVVCELVRQRPELPLTIKELAAAARMTPNHLTSLFGRCVGQSFTDYLALQRIERARKLLADVTLNVNEIGRLVGYDDPGYFARRFRQVTGVSPREWREQQLQPVRAKGAGGRPKAAR